MSELEKYSSLEAYQVAEMAKEKGLVLLEGNYLNPWDSTEIKSNGYCVAQVIAGQYVILADDGSVYPIQKLYGYYRNNTWEFQSTLKQAKERIVNFGGTIKNPPNFFAYVRVYSEEPEYYGFLQRLYLEEFARKHGITYKERFICTGGRQSTAEFSASTAEMDAVINSCKKSFSQITKDDFLVVSDTSRLAGDKYMWGVSFNIIPVNFEETSYTKYEYYKLEKAPERSGDEEEQEEDTEYEQMSQEHREMTMEQDDQTFIESEEQYG